MRLIHQRLKDSTYDTQHVSLHDQGLVRMLDALSSFVQAMLESETTNKLNLTEFLTFMTKLGDLTSLFDFASRLQQYFTKKEDQVKKELAETS